MAKFLFCLPRFHTNAAPWVRILKKGGHEVAIHVMSLGTTENHKEIKPIKLEPSILSNKILKISNDNLKEIRQTPGFRVYSKVLKEESPDVVIVRGVTRWFSRTAALATVIQGRRLVIYDQEDPQPHLSTTWLRRALFRILGISHVTARIAPKSTKGPFIELGSAATLPFGAPLNIMERLKPSYTDTPRILMVAKYRKRKGHELLINALAPLVKELKFKVTFCGEIANANDELFRNNLKDQAKQAGLDAQFLDNVPPEEMSIIYQAHEVFVLPSQNEPAAVSPIEAAWNGCVTLISHDSGTRDYLPEDVDFHFNPRNVDDVTKTLRNCLQDPVRLSQLRKKCRDHIENIASDKQILAIFEAMLPKHVNTIRIK